MKNSVHWSFDREAESKVVRDVGLDLYTSCCTLRARWLVRLVATCWRPADGGFQVCERSDWFLCFEIWTQVIKSTKGLRGPEFHGAIGAQTPDPWPQIRNPVRRVLRYKWKWPTREEVIVKMHVNWLRPEDGRMLMVCFSRREIGDRPEKSALLASPFQSQRLKRVE